MILIQINEALATAVDGARKHKVTWYAQAVAKFTQFLKSTSQLNADGIDEKIIRQYADWLNTTRASDRKVRLKPRSQKSYFDALAGLCTILVNSGTLDSHPCKNVAITKEQRRGVMAVTVEDRKAMLEAAGRSSRDYAIMMTFAYTGCRVEEICRMCPDEVDFGKRRIRILGKNNKWRAVFVAPAAMDAIERYYHKHRPDSKWPNIFVADQFPHAPLKPSGIGQLFRRYARIVEATDPYSAKAWRHRFAKDLLSSGADIKVVSEILGHEDPMFTAKTYIQYNDDELAAQYDKYMPSI